MKKILSKITFIDFLILFIIFYTVFLNIEGGLLSDVSLTVGSVLLGFLIAGRIIVILFNFSTHGKDDVFKKEISYFRPTWTKVAYLFIGITAFFFVWALLFNFLSY